MKKIILIIVIAALGACKTTQPTTEKVNLETLYSIVERGYMTAQPLTPEILARIKADCRLLTPQQKGQFLIYITSLLSPKSLDEIYKVCYFSNADLKGARLQYMYLRSCWLNNANFEGAMMYKTDITDANLVGANLRNANLRNAYMERAYIPAADLSNANLVDAKMEGVVYRELRDGKNGYDKSQWAILDGAKVSDSTVLSLPSLVILGYEIKQGIIVKK